jgi:hypothetical protein
VVQSPDEVLPVPPYVRVPLRPLAPPEAAGAELYAVSPVHSSKE